MYRYHQTDGMVATVDTDAICFSDDLLISCRHHWTHHTIFITDIMIFGWQVKCVKAIFNCFSLRSRLRFLTSKHKQVEFPGAVSAVNHVRFNVGGFAGSGNEGLAVGDTLVFYI